MKKNRAILNIFIVALAVVYTAILIVGNVTRVSVPVAVVTGSYAAEYAAKNKLNVVELADTEEVYFDQRYEFFDFNVEGNEVVLEAYSGVSDKLVIPNEIEGMDVVSIGENFFDGLDHVKEVYLPDGLESIEAEPTDGVTLYCDESSKFYQQNKDLDWKLETVFDSEFINRYLGTIDFTYNINEDGIEITKFVGGFQDVLVIPSYINGYPVTEVSMNLLGQANVVVIPETVTEISGETARTLYSDVFVVEVAFTLFAFVLALAAVNVILPRLNKKEEEFLSAPQILATVVYVFAQFGFSIYAIRSSAMTAYGAAIISTIIVICFAVIIFLGGIGRTHSQKVTDKVEVKTQRMKQIKTLATNLSDNVKDKELRKQVQRLEEEIRYSAPVTNENLTGIENKIEEYLTQLKEAIRDEQMEEIASLTKKTFELVKERNMLAKNYK